MRLIGSKCDQLGPINMFTWRVPMRKETHFVYKRLGFESWCKQIPKHFRSLSDVFILWWESDKKSFQVCQKNVAAFSCCGRVPTIFHLFFQDIYENLGIRLTIFRRVCSFQWNSESVEVFLEKEFMNRVCKNSFKKNSKNIPQLLQSQITKFPKPWNLFSFAFCNHIIIEKRYFRRCVL